MSKFKFKKFTVLQDQATMKIGTDGVLLGAWAPIEHNPINILDIGTGTGVIALMLAQRSRAELIDAIEIEDNAYVQAVTNFENSDWGDRLFCYHTDLKEFAAEIDDTYELIVCNPPFFKENFTTSSQARNQARFETAMPLTTLFNAVKKLIALNGIFALIIPQDRAQECLDIGQEFGLYPNAITRVKGNAHVQAKRSLIAFSLERKKHITKELIIEKERHIYTESYKNLVKDFYLKM